MYNQPFFVPNYMSSMAAPSMMRGMNAMRRFGSAAAPLMNGVGTASRGLGLMGKIGNGLSAFRAINWSGLITNASKTLNVVNQAIPLVRQVGPMMNNVRSMLKIASVFKDETDKNPKTNYQKKSYQPLYTNNTYSKKTNNQQQNTNNNPSHDNTRKLDNSIQQEELLPKKEENTPTFFIPA